MSKKAETALSRSERSTINKHAYQFVHSMRRQWWNALAPELIAVAEREGLDRALDPKVSLAAFWRVLDAIRPTP